MNSHNARSSVGATSPQSKADRAYEDIRHRLITLEVAPGDAINEAALADDLDVGRTPVREALKRLEGDHLVMSYPRRGTFATTVDMTDLSQISEVRELLEPLAARYAVAHCTGAVREQFQSLLDEVRGDKEVRSDNEARDNEAGSDNEARDNEAGSDKEVRADEAPRGDAPTTTGQPRHTQPEPTQPPPTLSRHALLEQDMRVHRTIYACVDNGYLAETLIRLDDLATRLWFMVLDRIPNVGESIQEHVLLLEGILAGDSDRVAALAAEHVRHFEQSVGQALGRGRAN